MGGPGLLIEFKESLSIWNETVLVRPASGAIIWQRPQALTANGF
jgi:hypothetical protein